jgi:hypothetical protein
MIANLNKIKYEILLFFQSPFGKQVLFYSFFYFILWSFHLILISITSYFHLLLNHNIRIIGDWISDRGWTLIIISKAVVFYLTLLFYRLRTNKVVSVQSYFKNSIQSPRMEFIVAWLFLLIGIMGIGNIRYNSTMIIDISRIFLSVIGTFIFYAMDFILLVILDVFFPIRDEKIRRKRVFIFSLLFYLFSSMTFIYEQTMTLRLLGCFFLLLYLSEWRRKNWTLPLFALIGFIIPLNAFLGIDPVWGEIYSPFAMGKNFTESSFLFLIATAVFYLEYKTKSMPEYIYRD